MDHFGPPPSANLFERLAKKIQPSTIKVIEVSIGPGSVNKRGSCINRAAECVFSRSQFIVLKGLTRLHSQIECSGCRVSRSTNLLLRRFEIVDARTARGQSHLSRLGCWAGTGCIELWRV